MLIYLIENTVNGKIYIGQTVQTLKDRMYSHKSDSKRNDSYLCKAIRKHGWESFKFYILDNTAKTQEQLNSNEISWIACFNSTNKKIGYNIENGGKGIGKMSDETKKKLSIANKGKTHSDETKKKISIAGTGRSHSEEAKKKISIANTGENHPMFGKQVSDETKKKLSIAHTGKITLEETKKKISIAHTGKIISDETKKKMSIAGTGRTHSEETKKKLSEIQILVDKETVNFIRNDYNDGMKLKDIMIKYNIKRGTTYNIISHKGVYKEW